MVVKNTHATKCNCDDYLPSSFIKFLKFLHFANNAGEVMVLPLKFILRVLFFIYELKDYKRYRRKRFVNFCSKLTENDWASFNSCVLGCSVIHLPGRPKFKILTSGKKKWLCSVEEVRCRSFHVSNRKNEQFSAWADIGPACGFYFPFSDRDHLTTNVV